MVVVMMMYAIRLHNFFSSFLLSWILDHACLDTCSFGCLICMHFIFLYLYLFSAIEHVSREKALYKHIIVRTLHRAVNTLNR